MFDILIIAIGKIKEKFYRDAFEEYLKRLSPYARIKVEELKAEPFKNDSDRQKSKQAEGERLLKFLATQKEAAVFVLDERGQEFVSTDFAKSLSKQQNKKLIFVVGGTVGLSEAVLSHKDFQFISLSKMTLPHELARVVLVEQLYRAVCLNRGKTYHY
jgi:23S rRNA (pseudouridine1915-N3)-methyltransferase